MRFPHLIFDLDGTLIDSLPGIQRSLSVALGKVLPARELPDLKPWVGPPLRSMLGRIWPDLSEAKLGELLQEFRTHYDAEGFLASEPYRGAEEILSGIRESGSTLFLLTNKPALPTERILEFLDWKRHFSSVYCPDSHGKVFESKELGARLLVEAEGLAPNPDCLALVGDSLDDARAAQSCGAFFIAAQYGYGKVTEQEECPIHLRIESLSQLKEVLLQ
ncbi:MAG: HAD family hydrolase [Blastochloris sp.]|nr:HAD family hydrolase [Blastochloris sp.]